MKIKKPITTLVLVFLVLFFGALLLMKLPQDIKCYLLPAGMNNISCYYGMMGIANSNPEKAAEMCGRMEDVPKKDGCYEFVAEINAKTNPRLAKEICDKTGGFRGVHSREGCHSEIAKAASRQ